jgi:hypothetical protein
MRPTLPLAAALCLAPSIALAQAYPLPLEAAVGIGASRDPRLYEWPLTLHGGIAWDYDEDWPGVPVVEGEFSVGSEAPPCQGPVEETPDTCVDAALLAGWRFRRRPHTSSGIRPFAQFLIGRYWKGSGLDEPEYASSHFALQAGGGIELRWANSIQGARVSLDVRHAFAGDRDVTQVRLGLWYVIGPRRFTRPAN